MVKCTDSRIKYLCYIYQCMNLVKIVFYVSVQNKQAQRKWPRTSMDPSGPPSGPKRDSSDPSEPYFPSRRSFERDQLYTESFNNSPLLMSSTFSLFSGGVIHLQHFSPSATPTNNLCKLTNNISQISSCFQT